MATATKIKDVYRIAKELDRLFPDQVDDTAVDHGNGTEAGHVGHDGTDTDWPSIGWFCDAGNVGNSLFSVHPDDIPIVCDALAKIESASYSLESVIGELRRGGARIES